MFKFFEKPLGMPKETTGPENRDFIPPEETGVTQYDQIMDKVAGDRRISEMHEQEEEKYQEKIERLDEQDPLHPYENIEEKFDREIEAEIKDMPLTANGPVKAKKDQTHVFKPFRPKGGETIRPSL